MSSRRQKQVLTLLLSILTVVMTALYRYSTEQEVLNNPLPTTETITVDPTPQAISPNRILASVVRVVDGDTIRVRLNETEETIRIIGINTPETVDPRRPVECFGNQASAAMKDLVTEKVVFLEADSTQQERDRYNRLLRYVYLEDGSDVGLTLLQQGYALEYTYSNPYLKQADYKQAQTEAQESKKGLWADETCAPN